MEPVSSAALRPLGTLLGKSVSWLNRPSSDLNDLRSASRLRRLERLREQAEAFEREFPQALWPNDVTSPPPAVGLDLARTARDVAAIPLSGRLRRRLFKQLRTRDEVVREAVIADAALQTAHAAWAEAATRLQTYEWRKASHLQIQTMAERHADTQYWDARDEFIASFTVAEERVREAHASVSRMKEHLDELLL